MTTEERVLKYVIRVNRDGTLPVLRDCAKSLRMKQEEVLDAAENLEADGDLSIGVGIGNYGGACVFERIGDYLLEPLYRTRRKPGCNVRYL